MIGRQRINKKIEALSKVWLQATPRLDVALQEEAEQMQQNYFCKMTSRLSTLPWLVCKQGSALLWLLSLAPAPRSEVPAEERKCCREGSAHQTCCPQPAQSRANVPWSLLAHGLMYYLPCVSQQVPRPAHFTSVFLLCSVLSCPCCGCRYLSAGLTLETWVRSISQWAIPCAMSSYVFRFTIRSAILAAFATMLRESTC